MMQLRFPPPGAESLSSHMPRRLSELGLGLGLELDNTPSSPPVELGIILQRTPIRVLAHLHQRDLLQNPGEEAASPRPLGRDSARQIGRRTRTA